MVSTRQMSHVSGSVSTSDEAGPSRPNRQSSVITSVSSVTPLTTETEINLINDVALITPSSHSSSPSLLTLPPELLEKIFVNLGFKKVAQMRTICHQMNQVCGAILSSTFQRLQTQMLQRFQTIKSKMPRRESARRSHPLACESDIVETLHMRLTLLQMTFGKHIERKHCCFFPGEILDEVYRILQYIKITQKLARPYKVTDELFDLSTMAMEYFKEHIEPKLPEIAYFGSDFLDFTGTFSDNNQLSIGDAKSDSASPPRSLEDRALSTPPPPQSNMVLRKRIRKIKQGMKRYDARPDIILLKQMTAK